VALPDWSCDVCLPQDDSDLAVKLEFDEDGEGATKENLSVSAAASKPKVPRVKREKKEPGRHVYQILSFKTSLPLPDLFIKLRPIFFYS